METMKRWEYKTYLVETVNDYHFVNDKALDGWELVCVVPVAKYTFIYWFKREKEVDNG